MMPPSPARVDLHTHTSASDGSLAPEALVEAAIAAGLKVIAITDHDTLDGFDRACMFAAERGLTLLAGLELSARHQGRNVHLLAYGFDPHSARLRATLKAQAEHREARAQQIVERLAAGGTPVSWEVVKEAGGAAVGRPHIARALVQAGHAHNVQDAFRRYLSDTSRAYIPSSAWSPSEAADLVLDAGGRVALAHPYAYATSLDLPVTMPALRAAGVSGIEAYHSAHGAEAATSLIALAASEGLWWCGGSDFHGPDRQQVALGSVPVPEAVLLQGPFPAALAAGG